jgi:hypothetical protein
LADAAVLPAPPTTRAPCGCEYARFMVLSIVSTSSGMLGANDIGTLAVAVGQIAAVSTGYGPVTIAGQGQMSVALLARS